MENVDPKCYGEFRKDSAACRGCPYGASCEFYALTKNPGRMGEEVSYEMANFLVECAYIPDEDTEENLVTLLSDFFSYLVRLDDYSLGILLQVIYPGTEKPQTVTTLAEKRGCSRQAMHNKILDLIAKKPELAFLFRSVLYKLPAARWSFLHKRMNKK